MPMPMLLTVCTLEDTHMVEHFVAVVDGMVSDDDRRRMAEGMSAVYWRPGDDREEDGRYLYFREVDLYESAAAVKSFVNVDGSGE